MIVLDTNIVIAFFGEEEKVVKALEKALEDGETILLPTIVKAETLGYQGINDDTMARMLQWFKDVILIQLDSELAERAAFLRRERRLKIIDCVIAATALAHNAKLATRDEEFERIAELNLLKW